MSLHKNMNLLYHYVSGKKAKWPVKIGSLTVREDTHNYYVFDVQSPPVYLVSLASMKQTLTPLRI
jgi:hypothetical protein